MQYYRNPNPGILRIAGPDQADFLQRQTSNDLGLLSAGNALPTVLTSPTARILDVFYLFQETENEGKGIRAISVTGNGARMTKYFKSRIFFMDKVTVEDLSDRYAQFSLFGEQDSQALQDLGIDDLPEACQLKRVEFQKDTLLVLSHHPQLGRGLLALVPVEQGDTFEKRLRGTGIASVSNETYEVFRIENGLPAAITELNENYTPFEVGLDSLVSTSKGCYTGQEILARQVTYDKIVRGLVGIQSDTLLPVGTALKQDGKPAGTVTSSVVSPGLGPVALAVVRRPYQEPGTVLQAGSDAVQVTVRKLPFD